MIKTYTIIAVRENNHGFDVMFTAEKTFIELGATCTSKITDYVFVNDKNEIDSSILNQLNITGWFNKAIN